MEAKTKKFQAKTTRQDLSNNTNENFKRYYLGRLAIVKVISVNANGSREISCSLREKNKKLIWEGEKKRKENEWEFNKMG